LVEQVGAELLKALVISDVWARGRAGATGLPSSVTAIWISAVALEVFVPPPELPLMLVFVNTPVTSEGVISRAVWLELGVLIVA